LAHIYTFSHLDRRTFQNGSPEGCRFENIPHKTPHVEEIAVVACVAASVFAILDLLSPPMGMTARQGAGFGLGANLVGFPARV